MSENGQALAVKALLAAQQAIGKVAKNCENPFHKSRYADYEAVLDAVKKPLNDNGFVIVHRGLVLEGKDYLQTALVHTAGGEFVSQFPVVVDGNPQHTGSAITYIKRYNLASLTGLATEEDDDGNAAAKVDAKPAAKAPASPPQTATKPVSLGGNLLVHVFMPSAVKKLKTKANKDMAFIKDGETSFTAFNAQEWETAEKALAEGKQIKLTYTDDGKYKTVKSVALAKPDALQEILETEPENAEVIE